MTSMVALVEFFAGAQPTGPPASSAAGLPCRISYGRQTCRSPRLSTLPVRPLSALFEFSPSGLEPTGPLAGGRHFADFHRCLNLPVHSTGAGLGRSSLLLRCPSRLSHPLLEALCCQKLPNKRGGRYPIFNQASGGLTPACS